MYVSYVYIHMYMHTYVLTQNTIRVTIKSLIEHTKILELITLTVFQNLPVYPLILFKSVTHCKAKQNFLMQVSISPLERLKEI